MSFNITGIGSLWNNQTNGFPNFVICIISRNKRCLVRSDIEEIQSFIYSYFISSKNYGENKLTFEGTRPNKKEKRRSIWRKHSTNTQTGSWIVRNRSYIRSQRRYREKKHYRKFIKIVRLSIVFKGFRLKHSEKVCLSYININSVRNRLETLLEILCAWLDFLAMS